MKILFLSHNVAWSGSFFRGFYWGRELVKRGHSVTILATSKKNKYYFTEYILDAVIIIEGPDLFSGRLRSGWDPWSTYRRLSFISKLNFDIIHCIDSRPNTIIPSLYHSKLTKSILVLDWLDWWGRGGSIKYRGISFLEKIFEPIETFFEENFRKYANGNITISVPLKKRAIGLGVSPETITTIPFGANCESIKQLDKMICRERHGYKKHDKFIGILGTLFKSDADFLFESLNMIPENIRLIAIGNSNFSIPKSYISDGRVIQRSNLSFDTLVEYLAICDYLLLPLKDNIANKGRWPSKICDYLAAGRPIIATRVGDIVDLFKNNIGYLSNDNPQEFSKTIINAFNNKDSMLLGNNARRIAENNLSWEILTNDLEKFYDKLR